MRQLLTREPPLWEQVITHNSTWQAIMRVLYLPPEAPFSPTSIYLDSPLTPKIATMLLQHADMDAFTQWQPELRMLTFQPTTPQVRDAALVLSAMSDVSWIDACIIQAGEQFTNVLPIAAALAFVCTDMLDLARDLRHDRDLAHVLATARALAYVLDRHRDITTARAHAHAHTLAHDLYLVREIRVDLQSARQHWMHDEEVTEAIERALEALQDLEQALGSHSPIFLQFIAAYDKRWPPLQPQTEGKDISSTPEAISLESLTPLVENLTSRDDEQREQARSVFRIERNASVLGRETIEQMAQQAVLHATTPNIGTQLEWALSQIVYDKPDWIQQWVEQLQVEPEQEKHIAEQILSNIHRMTPETFEAMLEMLPHASRQVNEALLHSLGWQLRLRSIPEGSHDKLQTLLFSWLEQENLPETCVTLIETLGHWQGDQATNIADALQKRGGQCVSNQEMASLFTALAQLASQATIASSVRDLLQKSRSQPSAVAALTRLEVVLAWKQNEQRGMSDGERSQVRSEMSAFLLKKLISLLLDATSCLRALLDAGTDDDPWDDNYHGVLVIAAQDCIDRSRSPDLLAIPNWPFRTFDDSGMVQPENTFELSAMQDALT